MICKNCGRGIPEKSIYCKCCGAKVLITETDIKKANTYQYLTVLFATLCFLGCLMPLSKFGMGLLLVILLCCGLCYLFYTAAINYAHAIYGRQGNFKGKKILNISIIVNTVCLVLVVIMML